MTRTDLGMVGLDGRLEEEMGKCASLESLQRPLRRGSLQTHMMLVQAEQGLGVQHRDQ